MFPSAFVGYFLCVSRDNEVYDRRHVKVFWDNGLSRQGLSFVARRLFLSGHKIGTALPSQLESLERNGKFALKLVYALTIILLFSQLRFDSILRWFCSEHLFFMKANDHGPMTVSMYFGR